MKAVTTLKEHAVSVLKSAETLAARVADLEPEKAEVILRRCANIGEQVAAIDEYLLNTVKRTEA